MYKKSLLPLFFILLVFLLAYVWLVKAQQETITDASNKILSLIETKNLADANIAIEQMKTIFADSADLPEMLYQIACKYEMIEAFKQAKVLNEQIAADFPKSSCGTQAALQFAKLKIYDLIKAGAYRACEQSIAQMEADFANCPNLPGRLWEVANRYDKLKAFAYSKGLCERIVVDYPEDEYASFAGLLSAKLNVYELVDSGDYESARTAAFEMIKDFAGHTQLSRRLYEAAQKFADEEAWVYAKELHGRIAANWPLDKYGMRAAVQQRQIEICELIDASNYKAAEKAVVRMKTDFAGYEILYEQLEDIGEVYDMAGRFEAAQELFREIIQNCPADSEVSVSVQARLKKYEIFSVIESGDANQIDTAIRQAGSQLTGGAAGKLDIFLNILGRLCYSGGRRGDVKQPADYFEAAVALWERVFTECPNSRWAPAACFIAAAVLAQELDDNTKAVNYFQKVADDWPGYKCADWAQSKVGNYLEEMVRTGQLPDEVARPLIVEAYQAVVDNYPKSEWVEYAQQRLNDYK
jgi:tetratricopeptide (TPR) repeat protein